MNVLKCIKCGEEIHSLKLVALCPRCGGFLIPHTTEIPKKKPGTGIWIWREALFSGLLKDRVSLGEGDTPLLKAKKLGRKLKVNNLILKVESRNPTGTFIDRGSATLVSVAKHLGVSSLAVAAIGDLGISIALYARRAGLKTKVYMPLSTSASKVAKALLTADNVVLTKDFKDSLTKANKFSEQIGSYAVTPSNPYLLDGYRTIAYEIATALPRDKLVNSTVLVPVGNGGLLTALWSAFSDLGIRVRYVGIKGCEETPLIKDIYVPSPIFKDLIIKIITESGGEIIPVCEDESISSMHELLIQEGLFVGAVGASSLAALRKLSRNSNTVIAILSGDGQPDNVVISKLLELRKNRALDLTNLKETKSRILEIVALKGPIHPYAIWKTLRQEYSQKITLRSIYQHVKDLQEAGYIYISGKTLVGGKERKLYSITPKALDILRL